MNPTQLFFTKILPAKWANDMRAESESWRIRCLECGASRTVWEAGGIRWRAASKGKRTIVGCSQCGGTRTAAVERVPKEE